MSPFGCRPTTFFRAGLDRHYSAGKTEALGQAPQNGPRQGFHSVTKAVVRERGAICRLESRRTRKAGRSRGQSAHDRRLSFPPPSGVSRHVAPAVRMLQMHPTSLSRARVSVRQPSQPATAPLFESCSVRKRARFFAHDGAPRGAWCSGHRLARAEWLRRGSVQLVRPAFRPAPTHSCTRASYAPF